MSQSLSCFQSATPAGVNAWTCGVRCSDSVMKSKDQVLELKKKIKSVGITDVYQ